MKVNAPAEFKNPRYRISSYPMPALNENDLDSLLKGALNGRLCTINRDGTIHVAPIWLKYEGGEILMGTLESSRKAINVKRNKKASVQIDISEGQLRGVLIYGEARLDYDDVIEKRISINEQYGSSREEAEAFVKDVPKEWKQVLIRVKPNKIVGLL